MEMACKVMKPLAIATDIVQKNACNLHQALNLIKGILGGHAVGRPSVGRRSEK
jgi:hypothetical protein